MRRLRAAGSVIAVPLLTAVLLSGMMAFTAAAWDGTCDTSQVCIWRDRDFAGPDAAQTGSLARYVGQYPGSSSNINDSASSSWNRYATKDVYFHNEWDYGGAVFCNDSALAYSWVGLFNNDAWSSHNVTGDDGAC